MSQPGISPGLKFKSIYTPEEAERRQSGALQDIVIPAMLEPEHDHPEAIMRHLCVFAIISLLAVCFGPSMSASAQSGRGGLDFGILETGVLPGGAEIPDLAGDTIDPAVEARQPARSNALPPPDDLFDASPRAPSKKRR